MIRSDACTSRALGWLLALLLAAGCGPQRKLSPQGGQTAGQSDGGDDSGGDDAEEETEEVAVDDFLPRLLEARCAHLDRCRLGVDQQSCLAASGLLVQGVSFDSAEADVLSVKEGKASFNGKKAAACLRLLEGLPCAGDFDAARLDCNAAFVGKLDEGEPCISSLACAHRKCLRERDGGCDGLCVARGCRDRSECGEGETCEDGRCRARSPEGESCESTFDCVEGLYCWKSPKGRRSCRPLPAGDGTDCLETDRCGPGFLCVHDEPSCVARPVAGESCEQRACAPGLRCVDDTCRPGLAPEEPCPTQGADECAEGLFCPTYGDGAGFCRPAPGPHQPCAGGFGGRCAEGLACGLDPLHQQPWCVPPAGEGDACGSFSPCGRELTCGSRKTCEPLAALGAACWLSSDCVPEAFCEHPPPGAVCRPSGGEGQRCHPDGSCAEGLRCVKGPGLGGDRCVAGGLAGEGTACATQEPGVCGEGLACIPVVLDASVAEDGRCLRGRRLGETCSTLLECGGLGSTLYCDVEGSGRCVRRDEPGQPCVELIPGHDRCNPATAWCDIHTGPPACRLLKGAGEPCQRNAECRGLFAPFRYCVSDPHVLGRYCSGDAGQCAP